MAIHEEVHLSLIGILIVVGLPILVLWLLYHFRHYTFAAIFGLVGILLLLGFLSFEVPTRSITSRHLDEPLGGPGRLSLAQTENSPHESTLDALWEKLTETQIDLASEYVEPAHSEKQSDNSRPSWVTSPPKAIGNIYRQSVQSDPYLSEEECRRALENEALPQAVCRRIEQLVAGQAGYPVQVASPLPLGIGPDFILREICVDDFIETLDLPVGEMKQVHVLLEFNDSVDSQLRQAWLDHEQASRLGVFGKYAGMTFGVLATIYGLLRIDTWTKGYYSQQLLWGSAVAIIAVVFLLVN